MTLRKLSDTIAQLARMKAPGGLGSAFPAADRLHDLEGFGTDPGNLRARLHVPERLDDRPALVVVLHGCTQSAAGYDAGSGWSRLADEQGFIVLFPEQRRANNPNLCFNWFSPGDTRRDGGEALSIREMVAHVVSRHAIDPARIFVTGLSAGGAMTAVMLATYPEIFAGGAIIAGLPYGIATSVPEALDRMRGHGGPVNAQLGDLVRRASTHRGPWPTISIWHGTGDVTVAASNAEATLEQWRSLHGVGPAPSAVEQVDGQKRRVWRDEAGRAVIEDYSIAGLGHGTPLSASGEDALGTAGPFMLEAGISSTRHIAAFWGLTATVEAASPRAKDAAADPEQRASATQPGLPAIRSATRVVEPPAVKAQAQASGVGKVIEDALRAAGLMR